MNDRGHQMTESEPNDLSAPGDIDLGRVWIGVAAQVWHRRPGLVERAAAGLLRSPGLARALVSTPSLFVPWLLASAVVFGVGAIVTHATSAPVVALLAPAVAGAGIAYAYGPGVDPAFELSRSMAVSDRMVLLVRVLALFAVNALLGLAASALSVTAAGIAFGWMVPMTAVSALALAVATLTRSPGVGMAAGITVWGLTVLGGQAYSGHFATAVRAHSLYLPYLAVAAICGAAVIIRTRIERGAA
jgi:hypothetical protein